MLPDAGPVRPPTEEVDEGLNLLRNLASALAD